MCMRTMTMRLDGAARTGHRMGSTRRLRSARELLAASPLYIRMGPTIARPDFQTPFTPLRAKIGSFLQFWRNSMVSINAVNREVFDKETTAIFPSWQAELCSRARVNWRCAEFNRARQTKLAKGHENQSCLC